MVANMANATTRLLIVLMFCLVLAQLGAIGTAPISAQTQATPPSYIVDYQREFVSYSSISTISGTTTQLDLTNATYTGTSSGADFLVTTRVLTSTAFTSPANVNVSFTSSYRSSTHSVNVAISAASGTLVTASVYSQGTEELFWSGVLELSGKTDVSGIAYLNSSTAASAIVALGFATEGGIETVWATINGSAVVMASLPTVTFSLSSSLEQRVSLQNSIPSAYTSFNASLGELNATGRMGLSYQGAEAVRSGGSTYPVAYWRGTSQIVFGAGQTSTDSHANGTALVWYGLNGTVLEYDSVLTLSGASHATSVGLSFARTVEGSSILIVSLPSTAGLVIHGNTFSTKVAVDGQSVTFVASAMASAEVEASATVTNVRTVYLNSSGTLLEVTLPQGSGYVYLDSSTQSGDAVNLAHVTAVGAANITYSGKKYQGVEANLTATGYILFNLSVSFSSVLVFKSASSGIVELNSQNYWYSAGKVYVFDDPATTYYAVDATPLTSTSATQATQHSSVSGTTPPSPNSATLIGALIALIIAVIAVVYAATQIKRRANRTSM